mmetsp:Transcript_88809/g.176546  ORF Transcript_88809/g.176546 Transcript_88809/m.176546 type:complete len:573 (+) Transcript_88809:144-1862(+)
MLSDLPSDFCQDATKIFVKRNGQVGPLREVTLPPHSKVSDLLEKSGKVLDLDGPERAFFSNGVEITDAENIDDSEVVSISCGEPFRNAEGPSGPTGGCVAGNYILAEKVGQGGFGSVVKGVHSETGEMAAIKFVPKDTFRSLSDLQRVFQEIQALRNLRHPNIVRILDVADHPDNVCFIMEFAAGGELRDYVERKKALSEEESRAFFRQIVQAVHYVHSKKIIHRDLKLENILLDANNRCKIVDFGLSYYVSSKERTVTDAGTEAYLAPEVFAGSSGQADPFKLDVWSLGVILYALVHGKLPFVRADTETCCRLNAEGPQFKEETSSGYRRLVVGMLTPDPEKRVSVNDIANDPWVAKHRFAMCDMVSGGDTPDSDAVLPGLPIPTYVSEDNIGGEKADGEKATLSGPPSESEDELQPLAETPVPTRRRPPAQRGQSESSHSPNVRARSPNPSSSSPNPRARSPQPRPASQSPAPNGRVRLRAAAQGVFVATTLAGSKPSRLPPRAARTRGANQGAGLPSPTKSDGNPFSPRSPPVAQASQPSVATRTMPARSIKQAAHDSSRCRSPERKGM